MRGVGRRCGIDRRHSELNEVLTFERRAAREKLRENQSERINVGPWPRRPERATELLGRTVPGRERAHPALGLLELPPLDVPHHLGDPEVEQLDERLFTAEGAADPDVVGLDVAVSDSTPVHHAQHLGEGLDDLLGFFERPTLGTEDRTLVLKNVLEGATFEPLQNDVRQLLALGGHQRARIACLHDGRAASRELAEERALLDEVLEQARTLVARDPAEALEALECHRQPPHQVRRPVDVENEPSPTAASTRYLSPIVLPTIPRWSCVIAENSHDALGASDMPMSRCAISACHVVR